MDGYDSICISRGRSRGAVNLNLADLRSRLLVVWKFMFDKSGAVLKMPLLSTSLGMPC